ncbi:MAG: hypothetical protein ABF301_08160 [Sulfurovum sp.]
MYQVQINNCTYLNVDEKNHNYILETNLGKIKLHISKHDELKKSLMQFTTCPFYIILEKEVSDLIDSNVYFEVASSQNTITLECTASCGLNYHI